MPVFLALLSPRMWFFAAIALLLVAIGIQTIRLDHAQTSLAQEQADRAKVEAQRERIAREHADAVARIQADNAAATQALSDAYAEDLRTRDNALAGARADGDSLRGAIASFSAARAGSAALDPSAVKHFQDRAATLGRLLGEADGLAEALAGAAERHGSEVRALKSKLIADRLACEAH